VATYEASRPPHRPYLVVRLAGDGDGQVLITQVGKSEPLLRCTTAMCKVQVDRGTALRLVALPGEGSTFAGWRQLPRRPLPALQPWLGDPFAGCVTDGLSAEELVQRAISTSALECGVSVNVDLRVEVGFGLQPEEQEIAFADVPTVDGIDAPPIDPDVEAPLEPEKLEEAPLEVAVIPPPPQEQVPPPPQEKPTDKPPPEKPPENLRSVEVPDEHVVDKAPDDATHLSDKNRDVAEETRATETNLDKESKGEAVASKESPDRTSPDVGGPDDKIRQLEETEPTADVRTDETDHTGEADHAEGVVRGDEGEAGEEGKSTASRGVFAMRDIWGRGAITEQGPSGGKKAGKKGRRGVKTQLAFEDYERIVGKDKVAKERQIAARKLSSRRGRWEQKMAAIKSALENFAPDIRPGNQTALKTRANPFAVYIARMHRRIHELWGFGFLEDLDGKSATHPLNDFDLFVVVEMAINPDGTVHKTTIAKTSGKLEFDVAALDTVLSAAPYEETPENIRSVDGRVYLRWGFYRNWRQCGTFNVEPYILTEIPGGAEPLDDGAMVKSVPRRGQAPVTPASQQEESKPSPTTSVKDDKALYAANLWVSGFATADVEKMVRFSAIPFRAGGTVAAETSGDLKTMYEGLLVESGPLRDWALLTGDEYARRVGAPVELGEGSLLLMVRTAKESFAVVMTRTKSGEFRATQLVR